MKTSMIKYMVDNNSTKIGAVIGLSFGIYAGLKHKKAVQYALLFGVFGGMMGMVINNSINEIKK